MSLVVTGVNWHDVTLLEIVLDEIVGCRGITTPDSTFMRESPSMAPTGKPLNAPPLMPTGPVPYFSNFDSTNCRHAEVSWYHDPPALDF